MLNIPLFSFLALLAALFSIRVLCGFFFSSFFLSCPLLMLSTPYVPVISSRGTPHASYRLLPPSLYRVRQPAKLSRFEEFSNVEITTREA